VRAWLAGGLILVTVATPWAAGSPSDVPAVLRTLLTSELRFSQGDLANLRNGEAVAHRTRATAAGEAGAAGIIRIAGHKETFVDLYRDIVQFKRGPNVTSIGLFGDPPSVADLAALELSADDLDLRDCKVGDCEVRLPAADIQRIQNEIDWHAADADARAIALFKTLFAGYVHAYAVGPADRVVQYDSDRPSIRPLDEFTALLAGASYLEKLVPGLTRHLDDYPANRLPGAENFIYWSTEKFGALAPFVSATHVTMTQLSPTLFVIVSRDVYSSRYFDASLSVTIAADAAQPGAFYLVYINRSRASALKGAFAGIRRSLVERRAKGSVEENLELTKLKVEKPAR
jgi:hypothetical protein